MGLCTCIKKHILVINLPWSQRMIWLEEKKSFWGERSISWRYSTVNPELFNSKGVKRKFKHHQVIIYYLSFNIKGLVPSINLFFCGKIGQACDHQVFQNDIKLLGDTIGTFFGNMSMYWMIFCVHTSRNVEYTSFESVNWLLNARNYEKIYVRKIE